MPNWWEQEPQNVTTQQAEWERSVARWRSVVGTGEGQPAAWRQPQPQPPLQTQAQPPIQPQTQPPIQAQGNMPAWWDLWRQRMQQPSPVARPPYRTPVLKPAEPTRPSTLAPPILPPGAPEYPTEQIDYRARGEEIAKEIFPWMKRPVPTDWPEWEQKLEVFLRRATIEGLGRVVMAWEKPEQRALLGGRPGEELYQVPGEEPSAVDPEEYRLLWDPIAHAKAVEQAKKEIPEKMPDWVPSWLSEGIFKPGEPLGIGDMLAEVYVGAPAVAKLWERLTERAPAARVAEQVGAAGLSLLQEPAIGLEELTGAAAIMARPESRNLSVEDWYPLTTKTWSLAYHQARGWLGSGPRDDPRWGEDVLGTALTSIADGRATAEQIALSREVLGAELVGQIAADPLNLLDWMFAANKAARGKAVTAAQAKLLDAAAESPEAARALGVLERAMAEAGLGDVEAFTRAAEAAGVTVEPGFLDQLRDLATKPFQLTPEAKAVRDLEDLTVVLAPPVNLANSGDEAIQILRMWADDPASLAPMFGRVPESLAGKKASVVLRGIIDDLAEMPSAKAKVWNPAKFWVDLDQVAHDALRLVHGYEEPGKIGKFFLSYKRLMSEVYLNAIFSPGYVTRNMFGDAAAMATDGLLTFEHVDDMDAFIGQFGELTTRRLMTEGAAGREALTGEGAIRSLMPGPLGRVSEKGQEITRFAEPFGRLPLGEESRYKRAIYSALKRFWNENAPGMLPDLPPAIRQGLGEDAAAHLRARLAYEPDLAKRRQALTDFLDGTKGQQLEPTRYLDPDDLDSMSPVILNKIRQDLASLDAESTVDDVREIINRAREAVEEAEQARLAEMEDLPAAVHVTTDIDEAEIADEVVDELADIVARTGDHDLAREVEEIKKAIPEVERQLDTARADLVDDLLTEPTPDGLEIILRANAEVEDLRHDWREALNRLRQETKAAYDKLPPGASADDLWKTYFRAIDEQWTDLANRRIARFADAQDQLRRFRGGESLDDILGKSRRALAEDRLLKASEVPDRPKGFLPGKVLRSDEDDKFEAFLAWHRGTLDNVRTNAWRAVYGAEPEDYGKVLDLLDSADRDIEQFGKATAGKVRKLYEQAEAEARKALAKHKSGKMGRLAVDAVWEKYYILRNDAWNKYWQAAAERWKIAERDVLWGNWARGPRMEPPAPVPTPRPPEAPPAPEAAQAAIPEAELMAADEEIVKNAIAKADQDWSDTERKAIERWTKRGQELPEAQPSIFPAAADIPPFTREQFVEGLKAVPGYSDQLVDDVVTLMDEYAKQWAKWTGRNPEEFFGLAGAGVHRGTPPTFELFQRAEDLDDPAFKAWFEGAYHKGRMPDGTPKTFYHGSPGSGFDWFDPGRADPQDLYGPGLYFTDDAEVASGYAGSVGRVELVDTPQNLLPRIQEAAVKAEHPEVRRAREVMWDYSDRWNEFVEARTGPYYSPADREALNALEREFNDAVKQFHAAEQQYGKSGAVVNWEMYMKEGPEAVDRLLTQFGMDPAGIIDQIGAPGVYPVYVSLKRPFDIQTMFDVEEASMITGRPLRQMRPLTTHYSGDDIYEMLKMQGASNPQGMPIKQWVNEKLQSLGYDGIAHPGGRIWGNKQHQVLIAFDSNQVKSVFNKGDWSKSKFLLCQGSEQAPRWYYKAEGVIDAKMPNKATVEQVRNILTKGGIKKDELQWNGVLRWLDNQEGMLTKEDVLGYLQSNRVQVEEVVKGDYAFTGEDARRLHELETAFDRTPEEIEEYHALRRRLLGTQGRQATPGAAETRYAAYTEPGGKEYRELLLTLPWQEPQPISFEEWLRAMRIPEERVDQGVRLAYQNDLANPYSMAYGRGTTYRGPHWEEPNVLAHVRFNERTGANGERVLFIEEIQSDWHQAGRAEGYRRPAPPPLPEETLTRFDEAKAAAQAYYDELKAKYGGRAPLVRASIEEQERFGELDRAARGYADEIRRHRQAVEASEVGVPAAPFANTWDELTLKRMMRWAAENDFDAIAWTTGAQQAARYDLSKMVDELEWFEDGGKLYGVKDGRAVFTQDGITRKDLPEYVGKELAGRILEQSPSGAGGRLLRGVDIEVGGEGMKGFYDRILPYSSDKLTKRWGIKAEDMLIIDPEEARALAELRQTDPNFIGIPPGPTVHGFNIPAGMKKDLLDEGLPLFQGGGGTAGAKGAVDFLDDGRALISFFESADASTAVHEVFHVFLKYAPPNERAILEMQFGLAVGDFERLYPVAVEHQWLSNLPRRSAAQEERMNQIASSAKKYEAAHEHWARAGERYLAEGIAPSPELEGVFQRFKEWLIDIYRKIVGSSIDVELNDTMRGVMDRLLAENPVPRAGDPFGKDLFDAKMSRRREEVANVITAARHRHPLDLEDASRLYQQGNPEELARMLEQQAQEYAELSTREGIKHAAYRQTHTGGEKRWQDMGWRANKPQYMEELPVWEQGQYTRAVRTQSTGAENELYWQLQGINPSASAAEKRVASKMFQEEQAALADWYYTLAMQAQDMAAGRAVPAAAEVPEIVARESLERMEALEALRQREDLDEILRELGFKRGDIWPGEAPPERPMPEWAEEFEGATAGRLYQRGTPPRPRLEETPSGRRFVTNAEGTGGRSFESSKTGRAEAKRYHQEQVRLWEESLAVPTVGKTYQSSYGPGKVISVEGKQATIRFPGGDTKEVPFEQIIDVEAAEAAGRPAFGMPAPGPAEPQQAAMWQAGEELPLFSGAAQRAEGARFAPPEAAAETMLPGFEPQMGDVEKYAARPAGEAAPEQLALGGEEATQLEGLRPKRKPKGQMTLWQEPKEQLGFWRMDPDQWRQYIEAINQPGATPGPLPHEILQRSTDATRRSLDKIEDGMARDWDDWQGVFADQSARAGLENWFNNEVTPSWYESRAVAYDYARSQADFSILDYSRRTNLDTWMSYIFPYHYWFTRAGKNWAQRLAKRPGMLANYVRSRDAMKLANQNAGRRQRFEGMVGVPFPWLPDWMGDKVYVDPIGLITPYGQIFGTDWDDSEDSKRGLRGVYNTAQRFGLRPYHIWDYLYNMGAFAKAGEMMGMSPTAAQQMLGSQYDKNVPYVLPQTGVVKGITALARQAGVEAIPPGGINIEAPFRRAIGLPAGEIWDPYRINRMLANLSAEQPQNMDLAQAALRAQELVTQDKDQTGKVWDPSSELAQQIAQEQGWNSEQLQQAQAMLADAMQKATMERSVGTMGWAMGPRMAVEPRGERAQLEMVEQARAQTWNPQQPGGSREAYEQFKQTHPAMYPRATQYNTLPGEQEYEAMPPGARANWLILRGQKEMLHEDYDRAVDDLLRAEPWNWSGRGELEDQRRAALAELEALYPLPEMEGDMPAILYGMNPPEMWNSTVEKELYQMQATKPDPGAFETDEGVDWDAYYREEEKWRAQLPKSFSFGVVMDGMYQKMDPTTAMRNFEQRYDSPLEAAYKLYQQDIASPAWDQYNQAKAEEDRLWPGMRDLQDQYWDLPKEQRGAFVRQHPGLPDYWDWKDQNGSAYARTVGKVGPVPATALIPAILARYQTKGWTEEELKGILEGVIFPSLSEQQDLKRGKQAQQTTAGAAQVAAGGGGYGATRAYSQYSPGELNYLKNKILRQWNARQGRYGGWGGGGGYSSRRYSDSDSQYPRWAPKEFTRGGPFTTSTYPTIWGGPFRT